MNFNRKKLSIVLPAYNEANNLKELLPEIFSNLSNINFEVIVVDTIEDLDNTQEICDESGALYVKRKLSNSFGEAVRTGIKETTGDVVIFMDADGSHEPKFILSLLDYIDDYDVVIASRYIKDGYSDNSFLLRFMSKILNFTYAFILDIPCKDVSNSFKAYRAEDLKKLDLYCENFDIVEEILYKICKSKMEIRIKEIPSTFQKRLYGKTKRNLFYFILTYLVTIIKLRLSK